MKHQRAGRGGRDFFLARGALQLFSYILRFCEFETIGLRYVLDVWIFLSALDPLLHTFKSKTSGNDFNILLLSYSFHNCRLEINYLTTKLLHLAFVWGHNFRSETSNCPLSILNLCWMWNPTSKSSIHCWSSIATDECAGLLTWEPWKLILAVGQSRFISRVFIVSIYIHVLNVIT